MSTFLGICLILIFIAVIFAAFATVTRFFIEEDFRKQILREYGDEIQIVKKDEMTKSFSRAYLVTRYYVQIRFLGIWFSYDYENEKPEAEKGVKMIKDYRAAKANLKSSAEVVSKEKL